jgi:hypothetical protein
MFSMLLAVGSWSRLAGAVFVEKISAGKKK